MTQYLPPNLLALFTPRDPIQYLPPIDKLSHEKRRQPYTGIANFVQYFENPADAPPKKTTETREERLERKRKERVEQAVYKLEQDLALWNPNNNSNGTSDPYKTLFIARINYDTSEAKLRREFGVYGRIKNIRVIHDIITNRPRGYAFIEYEDEADMHAAYKRADGKKIDGRRVVVDVERGRTVHGWRPRRLGGGLGGTRRGGSDVNTKYSGRDGNRKETSSQRPVSRSRERRRSRDRRRSRSRRRRSKSRDRYKSRSRSKERRRRRSRSRDRRKSFSRERRRRHSRSRSKSRKQKTSSQPKPPSPLPDAIVQPPVGMEDGYPVYQDDEYNNNMKYETPNYMPEENNGY